jgi:hypothetical protein
VFAEQQADPMLQNPPLEPRNRHERSLKAYGREEEIRPRLVSIVEACRYLGVSRTTFYQDLLRRVKTVRLGRRNLVELRSLDDLADELIGAVATDAAESAALHASTVDPE